MADRFRTVRARATLASAAVLGGVISGTPQALAVPAHPSPAASSPDLAGQAPAAQAEPLDPAALPKAERGRAPAVFPTPRSQRAEGRPAAVSKSVTLVTAPGADPAAVRAVRQLLASAGAEDFQETDGRQSSSPGLTVYLGGPAERVEPVAEGVLRQLGGPMPEKLPAGGYVLAAGETGPGRGAVVLAGQNAAGTFYAAQTLRQLLVRSERGGVAVAGAVVKDWPTAARRGLVEGFYGRPWTHQQRLAQLDFLGRTKQNTYLYAPGGDALRTSRWRDEYPSAQQRRFTELAERARANHVRLEWAVAPGQDFCYSSAEDLDTLTGKLKQLRGLGFGGFQLQFQDVSYTEWHCGSDRRRFGTGPDAAARAQAMLANKLRERLRAAFPGRSLTFSVLPTEYYQDGSTPYRKTLNRLLAKGISVGWTGVGVVPRKITAAQADEVREVFDRPVTTVDNYPVNDSSPNRIHLGPLTGRDRSVPAGDGGYLANAMIQPTASRVPLSTAADFAWNPERYDPAASWANAVHRLAGTPQAADALEVLARNSAASPLAAPDSEYLTPSAKDFWATVEPTVPGARPGSGKRRATPSTGFDQAAAQLRRGFTAMRTAPEQLGEVAGGTLARETGPWLAQLSRYGEAGENAVDMLTAQRRGDGAKAWRHQARVRTILTEIRRGPAEVGAGVLTPFLERALRTADNWAGEPADDGSGPGSSVPGAPGHEVGMMSDRRPATYYRSERPPQVGDWYGVDLGGVRKVGRVRVAMGGRAGGADGVLRSAVLEYSATDTPGGGGWRKVSSEVDGGVLTAKLPKGTEARHVRLRATGTQPTAVTISEFTVSGPEQAVRSASGGPRAERGAPLGAVTDGHPETVYRGSVAPSGDGADDLTVELGRARPLEKVTVATDPDSGTRAEVSVRRRDGSWERIGTLGGDGWSELPAKRTVADAIRLSWLPGSGAPVVNEVVPWFADAPAARVELPSAPVDVEAGGPAREADARMDSAGGTDAAAEVKVSAPKGVKVSAPKSVRVPRGRTVRVPLRVSVPKETASGERRVPVEVTVNGRAVRRELIVRVHPRTDVRDLVPGSAVRSSGDETEDFPAAAVADGDPRSRWSSPQGEEDAWVRVDLGKAQRLGRVVLQWQEASAARYRVQVSGDGEAWRDAAVVRAGQGGTEELRFDERGVRYVRVLMEERATRFGYSLFGVEAYAVRDEEVKDKKKG